MKQLAIRGDKQRYAEVIALLKMLGGHNTNGYTGDSKNAYYHLTSRNYINYDRLPCDEDNDKLYTLDEFWADFPYKVGDKVMIGFLNVKAEVKKMRWNEDKERIEYECKHISNGELTTAIAEDLIPIESEPAEANTKDEPINIAEILKNAPKGIKLYSAIHGNVTFIRIDENTPLPIVVGTCRGISTMFTKDGRYYDKWTEGECILFPSKDNRDWLTFKVEPQFPTMPYECIEELGIEKEVLQVQGYKSKQLYALRLLLICRDAWWKVDGNWKPDWNEWSEKYIIVINENSINDNGQLIDYSTNNVLAFRTKEIRDKFLETFRELIEQCKELI